MHSDSDVEATFGKLPIKHLVFVNENFIVYVDEEYDVDWRTTPEYDANSPKERSTHNEILNLAAAIETTPCQYLEPATTLSFKRLVAEGIARALLEDYGNAKRILAKAETFVTLRSQEKSRYWYLTASGWAGALGGFVGLLLWIYRVPARELLGPVVFDGLLACAAGTLGATLSIITRMGKVQLDCLSGRPLHYMEGASRVVAGGLSGVLVYLALLSGQLLPVILKAGDPQVAVLFAAFVAGASERWAPSIVSRVEGAGARSRDTQR